MTKYLIQALLTPTATRAALWRPSLELAAASAPSCDAHEKHEVRLYNVEPTSSASGVLPVAEQVFNGDLVQ